MMSQHLQSQQWVDWGGESDHNPIMLEIRSEVRKPPSPFKFNSAWISDPSFYDIVKSIWNPLSDRVGVWDGFSFMENLKRLKKRTLCWAKQEKLRRMLNWQILKTSLSVIPAKILWVFFLKL